MASEDQVPDDSGATPVGGGHEKQALSGIDRVVTTEDLAHPGVQKLILDRLDRAEATIRHLERYERDFHEVREKLVVAESSLRRLSSLDILQSVVLGVGCVMLGFIPSVWGRWGLVALVTTGGLALVGGCYFSKRSGA
jgi:hypothetical protein